MSSNAGQQSNVNAHVDNPPSYDKDRTTAGAPLGAHELAEKCTSESCGRDAVGGGTQQTTADNPTNRT